MANVVELLGPLTSTAFDSLVRASVQGGIFILFVWAACRLIPRLPASARCTLWWLASLKLAVAFLCVDPLPIPVLDPPPPAPVESVSAVPQSARISSTPGVAENATGPTHSAAFSWRFVAVGAWMAILTLLLATLVNRMRKINRIAGRAIEAPAEIQRVAARLSQSLELPKTPEARISEEVDTPLVLGPRRPVVVLPATRFAALSPEEQRMALCHELLHLQRRDLWLAWIPALAERLFFFHPLAHLAVREYQLTREAACDAAVIRALDARPGEYGRLLITLGISRLPMHLAAAGSPSSYSKLKRRITMLRDIPNTRRLRTAGWAAVLVAAFAITPLTFVARSQDREKPAQAALSTRAARNPSSPVAARPGVVAPAAAQPAAPSVQPGKGKETDLNYVLFLDEQRTMMSGSSADSSRAASFRKGKEQLLWFRRGEREYIVRDPAVLREVAEIYRPLQEVGGDQAKIGSKQAKIGGQQAEIGKQQAAVGRKQAEIGARQAQIGSRQAASAARRAGRERVDNDELVRERGELELEMQQLGREMDELSDQMEAFNKPMGELSKEMNSLSEEMNVLSRKMQEVSAKAAAEMSGLLGRAISSGAGTEVK
ncbi:MAG: hypothetical protein EHM23_20585 [Acidobacteria bacterium]|nr:MAG: hypothetical protein EHM23_20585 [Acidobacteriota bacterium]